MNELTNLQHKLTDSFSDTINLITRLIDVRSNNFPTVLEINAFLEKNADSYLQGSQELIDLISSTLNKKIHDIDIDTMKSDIENTAKIFLSIADDLELLSYNTICKTMSLGAQGAAIAHISHEIKRHSDRAKQLLASINSVFNKIYDDFFIMNKTFLENSNAVSNMTLERKSLMRQFEITSDITSLIQYSQFHDIFLQELDVIIDALDSVNQSTPEGTGEAVRLHELALERLQEIEQELFQVFTEIRQAISTFIFQINTDIHSIISRATVVKAEFQKAKGFSATIHGILHELSSRLENTSDVIAIARKEITTLHSFSKSFRNLLVIASIEIARLDGQDLTGVSKSMAETYQLLGTFTQKLEVSTNTWENLHVDLSSVLADADRNMMGLSSLTNENKVFELETKSEILDEELSFFKRNIVEAHFIESLDAKISSVDVLFRDSVKTMQSRLSALLKKVSPAVKESPAYQSGYQSAELRKIMAHQNDLSTIDFF